MKRFHVHVSVRDLDESTRFYAALFGAEPTVRKDDYAKWMLDDPRVNFAISTRAGAAGIDHLGPWRTGRRQHVHCGHAKPERGVRACAEHLHKHGSNGGQPAFDRRPVHPEVYRSLRGFQVCSPSVRFC